MLFDTTTAPQLKPWLVRTLEPICDAEPGALAEYILALLKHNVPESDMRRELTAQLDEFLEKECSTFIDTLFTVLRTKTYLPYGTDSAPKQPRAMDVGIPIPLESIIPSVPERGQKRSMDYDDRDGRPTKGPRLSVDGGQFPRYNNGMDHAQWNGNGQGSGMNMGGVGMGMAGPMNGRRPNGYQPPDQKRGLCRDYHNQGYCARGELCKYSHGDEAVIPGQLFPGPSMPMPYMGMYPNGGMPYGMNSGAGMNGGAYNPNEAQLDMRPMPSPQAAMGVGMGMGGGAGGIGGRSRAPIIPRAQQVGGSSSHAPRLLNASGELPVIQDLTPKVPKDESQPPIDLQNGAGHVHGLNNNTPNALMDVDESVDADTGFRGGMRGGRGRNGPQSNTNAQHMRPTKGRGDKTLVVEKIPEDKLSLDAVNGWFKRFGVVTNVAIDARSAKALITFAEHEQAHNAWKSQDAVFNNRFVKLFWHRPMEGHGQGGTKALAASASLVANINAAPPPPPTPLVVAAVPAAPKPPARKPSTPSLTVASLAAKQKLLEEQIAEQKSLMTQLGTTSGDEKKQIMARLRKLGEEMKPATSPAPTATPTPSPAIPRPSAQDEHERRERERLDKELENHSSTSQADSTTEPNTEDLKAKLARLKAEAASLGLADAPTEAPAYNAPYQPFRGRGRGRAARGGSFYRGSTLRGGPPRASMKLDNRPKKLLVKSVPDTGVQAVRDWFETTGQVDSFDTAENGDIVVAFRTRSGAEQGLAKGQNISQVGPVQISWHTGQAVSVPKKLATPSLTTEVPAMDTRADNEPPQTPAPVSHVDTQHHLPPQDEEEVVASGWGGDEDEDGMGML